MFLDHVQTLGEPIKRSEISKPQPASAGTLGISENILAALLEVRDELAAGLLEHDPQLRSRSNRGFNMAMWNSTVYGHSCGTVCCIGGWAEMKLSVDEHVLLRAHKGLDCLFYPPTPSSEWSEITPAQAVQAIDNFTTHDPGHANWREILTP